MIRGYGPYYYLVEGHWTKKGPRQKVLKYLGCSRPDLATAQRLAASSKRPSVKVSVSSPRLAAERAKAEKEISRSELKVKDILARNEAERSIIETTDVPEVRKEAVKKRRTEKAADELEAERENAQHSLDEYHREELNASTPSISWEKWSSQRKKEAQYVSETVGCSQIQADALNQRAKRAGKSYDRVDWDSIQGRDLTYSERVEKLDVQLGVRTRTKAEVSRSSKDFERVTAKWEKAPDQYQDEIEAASREYFYALKAEAY